MIILYFYLFVIFEEVFGDFIKCFDWFLTNTNYYSVKVNKLYARRETKTQTRTDANARKNREIIKLIFRNRQFDHVST